MNVEIFQERPNAAWFRSKAPRKVTYVATNAPFSFVKVLVPSGSQIQLEEGKDPHPQDFSLTKKWPVLLRANFVLTKDRQRPYYGHFCGKIHREGSCSKAARGP